MADSTLNRYAHIARRVHALLQDPCLLRGEALEIGSDGELATLLADTAFRLALYRAAMPGARLDSAPAISCLLEEVQRELLASATPAREYR